MRILILSSSSTLIILFFIFSMSSILDKKSLCLKISIVLFCYRIYVRLLQSTLFSPSFMHCDMIALKFSIWIVSSLSFDSSIAYCLESSFSNWSYSWLSFSGLNRPSFICYSCDSTWIILSILQVIVLF
jgi:hypothetical protein